MTAPAWDGRPPNADVSGYHWLRWVDKPQGLPFVGQWSLFEGRAGWSFHGSRYAPADVNESWTYLKPVPPYQDATADAGGQAEAARVPDDLVALSKRSGSGEWFVEHGATEDGLSRIDDGTMHGMFPVIGEAHEIELAAAAVNRLRAEIDAQERAAQDEASGKGRRP